MSTPTKKPRTAAGQRSRLYWGVPAVLGGLVLVVLVARWLMGLPAVASFVADYPGHSELPDNAPVGFPAWLAWQHFLNAFFLLLIIRTGWQVRTTTRPSGHWTRNNKGLIKTKNPPTKISLELWFHLTLDVLWILNGLVFAVLLFATGQWMRIVPTSWDVFPNALSAALQYASLDWPTENGWVNYNALQLLSYFATVFIAAPLAFITGLRMSGAWPKKAAGLNKAFPIEWARAVHFPVMIYFVAFIAVHVLLVLATGALRNLNHMYAVRDDDGWLGFWVFLASVVVMVAAWFLARPLFLRPIASLMGKVSR
ncbi:cytochrome b/b6 domain-containing protein [Pseudarthrobacter oxydans]|uniref:cytochrome b/b6 domain-containing protein n=1 Tax=Pseudarthrobacter oxydans TaxID=1671 RepID=UPI0038135DCF